MSTRSTLATVAAACSLVAACSSSGRGQPGESSPSLGTTDTDTCTYLQSNNTLEHAAAVVTSGGDDQGAADQLRTVRATAPTVFQTALSNVISGLGSGNKSLVIADTRLLAGMCSARGIHIDLPTGS